MISVEQMRKIDPAVIQMSDEELETLKADLYETVQLAFDVWWQEKKSGSKNPTGLLPVDKTEGSIKT